MCLFDDLSRLAPVGQRPRSGWEQAIGFLPSPTRLIVKYLIQHLSRGSVFIFRFACAKNDRSMRS